MKCPAIFLCVFTTALLPAAARSADEPLPPEARAGETFAVSVAPATTFVGPALEPAVATEPDPCADPEMQPNSMSPTWNRQAGTVQCGALETDNVAVLQSLGGGVSQWNVGTTAKYGLTPRLELRWGLPGRNYQGGNGSPRLAGTTDQWLGVLFHFHDQHQWIPDLALDYALKLPTANPAKGFGSGYADHMLTFIASRDQGPNHIDFNTLGTVAGGPGGHEGAAQMGLGFSRSFAHHLMGTIEAFGGSQPATRDRYGAAFLGGSLGLRPWLALNGGCIRSYTAGSPRAQYIFGFIYTVRPGFVPPRGFRLIHMLGR